MSRYGELQACSKQWVLRRRRNVCDEEQARMPEGSEFHTEETATLKPWETKIVWTRGTDNRLVLAEHENVPGCGS